MLVGGRGVSLSEFVRSLSGLSNESMERLGGCICGCRSGEALIDGIWGVIGITMLFCSEEDEGERDGALAFALIGAGWVFVGIFVCLANVLSRRCGAFLVRGAAFATRCVRCGTRRSG